MSMCSNPIHEEITRKIKNLSTETKEHFTLVMTFFSNMLESKDSEISELLEKVALLEDKVEKLESNIDETAQYERRDTFVLSGPNVPTAEQGENCKRIILKLFHEHLQLNLNESDIATAQRIGRKQNNDEVTSCHRKNQNVNETTLLHRDNRNIIMTFHSRDLVRDIYGACKSKRPPFFINGSLTPLRSKIIYVLRQLKKKFPAKIKGCCTCDGKPRVFIATESQQNLSENVTKSTECLQKHLKIGTESSKRKQSDTAGSQAISKNATKSTNQRSISITTKLELEKFIHEHLDFTLSEFSSDWCTVF